MKRVVSSVLHTFIFSLAVLHITCDVPADKVEELFYSVYTNDIYSGYLSTASPSRSLHYIFLPSQSNNITDPVVLWLNGGPGCSSMFGLLQEHGPVSISLSGKVEFELNPYSWNKNAHMLYLESPAGVGFSKTDDYIFDDDKSANDNLNALKDFFSKFPEYKDNDFYISGESYAGVYVPKLADAILANANLGINLKGFIVGNGVTDVDVDIQVALVDFAYEHALYSEETRKKILKYCTPTQTFLGNFKDYPAKNVTKKCNEARNEILTALQGTNVYDIYRECVPADPSSSSPSYQQATINALKALSKLRFSQPEAGIAGLNFFGEELEPELPIWPAGCKDDPFLENWANRNLTKRKLHVDHDIKWTSCNGKIGENYKMGDSFLTYKDILFKTNLRIWFYSGDTDAAVPFNGSKKWISKLNFEVKDEYHKWVVDGQTAGFVQEYKNGFVFATVFGTGHMAPQWKKKESFVLFNSFLKGAKLPVS